MPPRLDYCNHLSFDWLKTIRGPLHIPDAPSACMHSDRKYFQYHFPLLVNFESSIYDNEEVIIF